MKIITFFLLLFFSKLSFSQVNDDAILTLYWVEKFTDGNKIARLYLDENPKIGIRKGWFDTIRVKPGCYRFRVITNSESTNSCFQVNEKYFYRVEYEQVFLWGKVRLVEVTKTFAEKEILEHELEKRSYKY